MPGGRPSELSKLTDEIRAQILAEIRRGVSPKCAAALVGVDNSTWWRWMQRDDEPYASFARAVRIAEDAWEADQLAAISSSPDWRARTWMLERRRREEYRPPTTTSEVKATVQSAEDLTLEEIEARIAELRSSGD